MSTRLYWFSARSAIFLLTLATVLVCSLSAAASKPTLFDSSSSLQFFNVTTYQPYFQRLVSPDPVINGQFGVSLDVDRLGTRAIVGAPNTRNESGQIVGEAYVYLLTESGWILEAELNFPSVDPNRNSGFGGAVAIDGETAVVGANLYNSGQGAVFIFVRDGFSWALRQTILLPDTILAPRFGWSVAVRDEAIVVGAYNETVPGGSGSAYLFLRSGAEWIQAARLRDLTTAIPNLYGFGRSVDLTDSRIIVGAPLARVNGSSPQTGATLIFSRTGAVCSLQSVLTPSDGEEGDWFGTDVSIENDTAIIGSQYVGITGAAYAYSFSGEHWVERQKLLDPSGVSRLFGMSVDISGNRVLIGDRSSGITPSDSIGAAHQFVFRNNEWRYQNRYVHGTTAESAGESVGLAGKRLLSGAPLNWNAPIQNSGTVYYFIESPSTPDLIPSDDTGISDSDNVTTSRNLTFNVDGATVGAVVELLRDGIVVDSRVASAPSLTLIEPQSPPNGTFKYVTRQTVDNEVSSPSNFVSVTVDNTAPLVAINQRTGQQDPTNGTSFDFQISNSEAIFGLTPQDISLASSSANVANALVTVTTTSSPIIVTVSNVISNGLYIEASIPSGALTDRAGNSSVQFPSDDNRITIDNVRPTVTINQAPGQMDPTSTQPINFSVEFSEPVTQFSWPGGISIAGTTASFSNLSVVISGTGTTYNVAISGLGPNNGNLVRMSVVEYARDALGNVNLPSTSVDNTVTIDNVGPTVTMSVSPGQPIQTNQLPISFLVTFGESVTGFGIDDLLFEGTGVDTSSASFELLGTGPVYTFRIGGLISDGGSVRYRIRPGAVVDLLGNPSSTTVSTSVALDNVKPRVTIDQAVNQADPTNALPVLFTAAFSESVSGFTSGDVSLAGSTADVSGATVSLSPMGGNIFSVAVGNVLTSGTIRATIAEDVVTDARGNSNLASTSTDNVVMYLRDTTPSPTPTNTPTPTPTNTPTATPTPPPSLGFEGDVAPRPNGDGVVLSTDVTQLRRFATGLDTPGIGTNEAQRADIAPRATFGDGIVNSGDVVQGRRYATGLDPLTGVGGPASQSIITERISKIIEDIYAYFSGREIQLGAVRSRNKNTLTVPVEITPHGDEQAVGFTLEFDDSKLANPRVSLGEAAPEGSVLTANAPGNGRVAILVDSSNGMIASAVPRQIVLVTFDMAAGFHGTTPIRFSDSLAARGSSDADGNTLPTRWLDGSVTLGF